MHKECNAPKKEEEEEEEEGLGTPGIMIHFCRDLSTLIRHFISTVKHFRLCWKGTCRHLDICIFH